MVVVAVAVAVAFAVVGFVFGGVAVADYGAGYVWEAKGRKRRLPRFLCAVPRWLVGFVDGEINWSGLMVVNVAVTKAVEVAPAEAIWAAVVRLVANPLLATVSTKAASSALEVAITGNIYPTLRRSRERR